MAMPMRSKSSLLGGYGIARTTPGLFDQVRDRHGAPANLQVMRPRQMAKLIRDRRAAGVPLGEPISPEEYRKRFGK
jgi:hypothetical protein